MPLTADLRHFKLSEFKHPELVNADAANFLDEIRDQFGFPLTITDDARLPGEVPPGGSTTSLHFKGQAFDLRTRGFTEEMMFKLASSVINVALWVARGQKSGVEFEIDNSPDEPHVHIGFFLGDGRQNRLFVVTETK